MGGLESLIPTKGSVSGSDENNLDRIEMQNAIIDDAKKRIYTTMCNLYPIGRKVAFKRGNKVTRGSVHAVIADNLNIEITVARTGNKRNFYHREMVSLGGSPDEKK